MITGVIKNKIDKIWTDIWAGGITNPQVLQKIITGLDETQLLFDSLIQEYFG